MGLSQISRGCRDGVASASGVNHVKRSRFLSPGSLSPSSRLCGQWREMSDGFINRLFPFRISKGLSEMVFAKSEGQKRKAEEDVDDTGTVKLLKSGRCDMHLQNFGKFKFHLGNYLLYCHPDIYHIWQITLVPLVYHTNCLFKKNIFIYGCSGSSLLLLGFL